MKRNKILFAIAAGLIVSALLLLCCESRGSTVTNSNGTVSVTNQPNIVSLTWDVTTNADGYTVYYGTNSRAYTSYKVAGNTNFISVGLGPKTTNSVTWFFAATVTVAGLESDYSLEAQYTPVALPMPPTGLKPPLKLAVQQKASASDFVWVDTGMGWDVSPLDTSALYRLVISNPVPLVASASVVPLIHISPPPLPGQ